MWVLHAQHAQMNDCPPLRSLCVFSPTSVHRSFTANSACACKASGTMQRSALEQVSPEAAPQAKWCCFWPQICDLRAARDRDNRQASAALASAHAAVEELRRDAAAKDAQIGQLMAMLQASRGQTAHANAAKVNAELRVGAASFAL